MLKRTMAAVLALTVVLAAGSAFAQACNVGVYADDAGTLNAFLPTQGTVFDTYVVIFTEDILDAVGPYTKTGPEGLNTEIFSMGRTYGPSGSGLNIQNADGDNIGLGECAVGFGGQPVVVETESYLIPFRSNVMRTIAIQGTPNYSTCPGVIKPCDVGSSLVLTGVIANVDESWGAVKSLYGN